MINSSFDIDDLNTNYDIEEEFILSKAKQGDSKSIEILINKYKKFIQLKSKSYFLIGADKEDIYQEGLIGLYKAIRDYNSNKLSSFKCFAELCITRQIITAIKTATRQKHIPLNTYISLNKPIYDDESDKTLLDITESLRISDPEDLFVDKEQINEIERHVLRNLSRYEKIVLHYYIIGRSYQQIAYLLDRQPKSIDNAIQRIKRKLLKCFKKD
ncbi:RNA polymerase sporulation sigma factor SigH [Candidatus Arthromitus sp. SFB-rat-Yit]|uniref:RNA polymerase sporulation sigma factor SigH n=1 Tax=Candidatus Arthromitus sp. SFB-rat-Yit TaxID=1041504 RepID=UPI000227A81C|nr:RNA polymerase sporulation sigma factor SigH [Candidatus Arthromitus sp. SFB-rat-Yit]BAK81802.1 RNA polymerase sigma-H factor [Candidatus Arthromitus sp. SFB-rat-Yit]